jgi:5-methylcytosine-specific restriction endonuclease McrA
VAGSAQLERLAMIQFCASEAFMAKFEKVKSLVWHRLPANPSLEQVFELALDLLIEREDPSRRQERRVQRASRDANRPAKVVEGARKPRENPRRVPADVRDRVFVRDKGQCAFRGPDGRRCTSTTALQVDHVRPVARGGGGTADNLRLLCAYHNRLEAVRLMGSCGSRDGT